MREYLTEEPCVKCLTLHGEGAVRRETIQRLPEGALAPMCPATGARICWDCNAAYTLVKLSIGLTYHMARVAVQNCRQEQYRLPGAPLGLVGQGLVKANEPGDFEDQLRWIDEVLVPDYLRMPNPFQELT